MTVCTVRHRSAETRARCSVCSRKNSRRKSPSSASGDSHADKKLAKAQSMFVDGWRNNDAWQLMNSLRCTTAGVSQRELDDFDSDFSTWQYVVGGAALNTPEDELDDLYDDIVDKRSQLESRMEPIEGYVTRGVKTPRFSSLDELDEYVQDVADSGEFAFSTMEGIREDSYAPFTRRPAMAGMFAKGMTRMWESEGSVRSAVSRAKDKHGLSGYIVKASNVDGYHVRFDEPDFCEKAEAEVLVRSDKLEAVDFIPARESGYGIPVIVVQGS